MAYSRNEANEAKGSSGNGGTTDSGLKTISQPSISFRWSITSFG